MISLDISIVYQVILFVVLWLMLNKVLFQPYLKILQEREERTSGAQHDSSDLEQEGARLRSQYEEKIMAAQAAAYAARERILQNARDERDQVLGQARQQAARVLEQARQEIAAAVAAEQRLAAAEATAIAGEIASKVLGRKIA